MARVSVTSPAVAARPPDEPRRVSVDLDHLRASRGQGFRGLRAEGLGS